MTHFTLAHYKVSQGERADASAPKYYPQPHPVPPAQPQTILSHMEENQQWSRSYESPNTRWDSLLTRARAWADRKHLRLGH